MVYAQLPCRSCCTLLERLLSGYVHLVHGTGSASNQPNLPCPPPPLQTALGGKIRFDKVLAARQGDIFVRGQPYVSEMSVEAELVEEFSLGASLNSFDISASSSVSVGKVLVTKIRHTSKTQQVLQEMLSQ